MAWFYLLLAILLEVAGTISMKLAAGFNNLIPSILVFIFYGLSLASLTVALKGIELGIAYAIWAGLGTTLIVIIGIIQFNESTSVIKFICIVLIIAGVVGLKLSNSNLNSDLIDKHHTASK